MHSENNEQGSTGFVRQKYELLARVGLLKIIAEQGALGL